MSNKTEITIPTYEELDLAYMGAEGPLTLIKQEITSPTRWGHVCCDVFKHDENDTYWEINYSVESGDMGYSGFHEQNYDIYQVEPYERTVVDYRNVSKS